MQTIFPEELAISSSGKEAYRILRSCVHCGFCTATCPTYRLMGDELDSPRGRIYLIKGLLEGKESSQKTMLHLDRCLTCLSCETHCQELNMDIYLISADKKSQQRLNDHIRTGYFGSC